jgi:hypothetical protein
MTDQEAIARVARAGRAAAEAAANLSEAAAQPRPKRHKGEVQQAVLAWYKARPGIVAHFNDVAHELGMDPASVNNSQGRLAKAGWLRFESRGSYVYSGRRRSVPMQPGKPRPADRLKVGTYLEVTSFTASGDVIAKCEENIAWKIVRI